MDGWTIFAWSAVCGLGMLLFLTTVAGHVGRTEQALTETERRRRKRFILQRQQEEDEEQGGPAIEVVE